MSQINDALVSELRRQIEEKYRDVLKAVETIEAYLKQAGHELPQEANPPSIAAEYGSADDETKTRVALVLEAIAHTAKTVEAISIETGLSEHSVRAVLYSRSVDPKLCRSTIGGKIAFKVREATPEGSAGMRGISSAVLRLLSKQAEGLTLREIAAELGPEVQEQENNKKRLRSALYALKKSRKIMHNTMTGAYSLCRVASGEKLEGAGV